MDWLSVVNDYLIVRYGMYFRRISLLKFIFLLLWVQLGSDYQKMKGFKFSSPSFLFDRVISVLAPRVDYVPTYSIWKPIKTM